MTFECSTGPIASFRCGAAIRSFWSESGHRAEFYELRARSISSCAAIAVRRTASLRSPTCLASTSSAARRGWPDKPGHDDVVDTFRSLRERRDQTTPRCRIGRPGRDRLGGGDDGVGVDAVVAVEILDRAGLAEMLDAERPHAVAMDGAKPR